MRKIITTIIAVMLITLMAVPVFAMDPTTASFTLVNQGKETVTLNISRDEYSEDLTLKGGERKTMEYSFDEPGAYEYTIKRTDAAGDSTYIVCLYVESNKDGKLISYVIPRISGKKEKPAELVFGTPEEPEKETTIKPVDNKDTGDQSNIQAYFIIICAAAGVIIALLLALLLINMNKKKANKDQNK